MATNLELDPTLLEEARSLGGHATKRATVQAALAEYVARRRRLQVLELFGTVDWEPSWDWKRERSR